MAFVANSTQQLTLMDSPFNLTEGEKRFLEKSWAKTFAEKVFPTIAESIFSALYSDKASRPNTPVNVIVGALILKEALGDTDDEESGKIKRLAILINRVFLKYDKSV